MQPIESYNISAYGKQIFSACTQSAQAITVALNTTYTGLCLSNPNASLVNLFLLRVKAALSVAPAAIAPIGLIGAKSGTDVTHTAAATIQSNFLGSTFPGPSGLVDTQATIPTPKWLEMIEGGFTAAALPNPTLPFDFRGSWVIPPGGFIAIGALTAVTGFLSICWAESNISSP